MWPLSLYLDLGIRVWPRECGGSLPSLYFFYCDIISSHLVIRRSKGLLYVGGEVLLGGLQGDVVCVSNVLGFGQVGKCGQNVHQNTEECGSHDSFSRRPVLQRVVA